MAFKQSSGAKIVMNSREVLKDFVAKEEDLLPFYSQLKMHDRSYVLLPDGAIC
jgi:hypothetical protein